MAKVVQRGISLFIDDKEIKNNISSVKREMTKIVNEQSKMTIGSKEYLASAAKLKGLQEIVTQHGKDIGRIPGFWAKAKDSIVSTGFGVLGGNILTAIGSKIGGFFGGLIDGNAKLSDSMADISKTTGMSTKEVEGLVKSIGKIDTRTATADLRNIAVVAGQLGISKDQVEGFVSSVDKINVALGDEISGGAEVVAETVGKLRNVMGDIQTQDVGTDLMHIGNALNVLGAAGFATSPVIADFANRIGGIGIPLGMTSGQVMGLSATFQELNISTERGGTAMGKILMKMSTNTKEFSRVAGMDVTKFTQLVNKDMYGAFMAVVEGSQKSGDSATGLSQIIKDLDVDGAGASEIFMKLGKNVDMATEKVGLATNALKNTDSIMSEFNIKNENFAAKWEKTKKMIDKVVMSIATGMKGALTWMIDALQNSIKWVQRNGDLIATMGHIIGGVIAVIVTYISVSKIQSVVETLKTKSIKDWISALKESVIVTKLKILWEKASRASSLLLSSAQYLLAGNIQKASQAFRLFSATLGASPIGLAAAAIVAIGAALYYLSTQQESSKSRLQEWGETNKEAYGKLLKSEDIMKSLGATIKDGNIAQKDRNDALENYNKIAVDSNLLTLDMADSEDILNTKMAANLFMMEARIQSEIIENEIMSALIEKRKLEKDLADAGDGYTKNLIQAGLDAINSKISGLRAEAKGYKDIQDQITKEIEKQRKARADADAAERKRKADAKKSGTGTDSGEEEIKKLEDLNKQIAKLEDERKLRRTGDTMKEEEQIRQKYADLLKLAQGHLVQLKKLEELQADEIFDAKQKKLDDQAKELRKKALDIEKDLAKKIADFKADASDDELTKEIANNDNKWAELINSNNTAIAYIKQMGDRATDAELATLKNLLKQNSELYDIWGDEDTKIRKKHLDKQAKDRKEVEDKIADILSTGKDKEKREVVKKYSELIEQAKKFGIDTTALTKAMNAELEKLNKKSTASLIGMSEESFAKLKGKIDSIIKYASQGAEILGAYNDLQKTKSDNEVAKFEKDQQKKKDALDIRLKKGLISQKRYDAEMAVIDGETENRKKKAASEEARRQKKLKLAQAGISMASAIIGFLADPGGLPGIILSASAAVIGALQIANIENTDVEGYEQGGFTNGDKLYRAGEKGKKEFITPNWMLSHPVSGPIVESLARFRVSKNPSVLAPDFDSINRSFVKVGANSYSSQTAQQNAIVTQLQQNQLNNNIVASKIDSLTLEFKEMNKNLANTSKYLSDPNNRRAYIANDEFKKTQKELTLVEKLSTYGFKKAK